MNSLSSQWCWDVNKPQLSVLIIHISLVRALQYWPWEKSTMPSFSLLIFKRKDGVEAGFADPALTSPTLTDSSGCCLDIFVTIREPHCCCCCCWWSHRVCFWTHGHELRQARAGVKPRTFCVWVNQRDHVLPSHLISLFVVPLNTCCSEHGSRQLTGPLKRFATPTPSLWNLQRKDRSSSRAQTWLSRALSRLLLCVSSAA